jgi:hypothetical protein
MGGILSKNFLIIVKQRYEKEELMIEKRWRIGRVGGHSWSFVVEGGEEKKS